MRRRLRFALLAMVSLSALPALAEDAPVALFDGKTLNGWKKVGGGATYRVEDGTIVGEVGPGANTFLRTEKTYADFTLELDFKLDVPGNSGIQIRSHQREGENGRVYGYQSEIDPSERAWTAGIYDEARRGWLFPLTGHPEAQKAFKLTDWNHLKIVAIGPHITTNLNGVPCADLIDMMDAEGFIALQVHSGKAGRIRWKNITLRDHGRTGSKPLWNGKDLTGWAAFGGGHWTVEDGAIHGVSSKSEAKHGHLFSGPVGNQFALKLKFKPVKGDSGLYFLAREGGKSGVIGLQANIDPEKDSGGIYEIDGRGWLARPKPEDIKKWLKPGEWNDLAVVVLNGPKGGRAVVQVNGWTTAQLDDVRIPDDFGRFALQVHASQDVDVWFKDIEVRTFDRTP